jgi:hypothetical protein
MRKSKKGEGQFEKCCWLVFAKRIDERIDEEEKEEDDEAAAAKARQVLQMNEDKWSRAKWKDEAMEDRDCEDGSASAREREARRRHENARERQKERRRKARSEGEEEAEAGR